MKRYNFKSDMKDATVFPVQDNDGGWVTYDAHIAAIRELTDRLAKVEKERDVLKDRESQMGRQLAMASIELEDAHKERDELRSALYGCIGVHPELKGMGNVQHAIDISEPRDPSAEQGGGK